MLNFPEFVREVVHQPLANIEGRACPDQYVGIVRNVQDGFHRQNVRCRPPDRRYVILILESPHKAEYARELGPAQGNTGTLIRRHVANLECFQHCQDFGLILMNAIQYQCSLGCSPSSFRDVVFRNVWRNGGSECFVERLRSYLRDNDVVANCCTKGSVPELRTLVQSTLAENFRHLAVKRRTHPSSWWSGINRNAEWAFNVQD